MVILRHYYKQSQQVQPFKTNFIRVNQFLDLCSCTLFAIDYCLKVSQLIK